MPERRGITGWGAYVPRLRLERSAIAASLAWLSQGKSRAKGTRSYCNWDEDALTMALEAARDCLGDGVSAGATRSAASGTAQPGAGGTARPQLDALWLASTTLPFADRSNAGLVASALDLDSTCRTLDSAGSLRAGSTALRAALEGRGNALVIGADARAAKPASPQELAYGHAAAALRVGDAHVVAEYLGGDSASFDFVDHYRETGADFDYAFEERWVRDEGYAKLVPPVVKGALASAGVDAKSVAHFVFPVGAAHAKKLAQTVGVPEGAVRDGLQDSCGDTGAAHALLLLGAALEAAKAGDVIVVVGFGQGVDALVFRATDRIAGAKPARGVAGSLAAGQNDTAYTRYLSHSGLLALDFGMRAERDARTSQSVYWRKHHDVAGLVGGRCTKCGTVQFPRSRACVNPDCREFDTQVEHRIADTPGRVKTFTEDWLAYSPSPPLVYGNVELEGGGNLFIEFTDVGPGEAQVGAPLRLVWRVKDVDRVRGFRRYFWKATLARG